MYDDLLGPRKEKKERKKKVNLITEEKTKEDLESHGNNGLDEGFDDDPWDDVDDEIDLDDLKMMDDCDGNCEDCDLEESEDIGC